ncbi:Peroxin 13, N-terminal region-domain-containing protein [Powellomyces hirtus]|nr:Peroxin 13, N-terminal region-domain-containing protein [Powellomyces hirtus]
MPSPPKPWERAGGGGTASPGGTTPTPMGVTPSAGSTTTTSSSSTGPAAPPSRPETAAPSMAVNPAVNRTGFGTTGFVGSSYNSGYGSTGYGAGSYGGSYGMGGTYGSNSMSSPYSRYGGTGYGGYGSSYGSSYGGGYGGYGSRLGNSGYGAGGYGNRFGGGPYVGGPGEGMPLSAQMEQSTMATFNTLDSVVQAFAGFSQMLESTFMATHSSFMAMVGVAEQFGNLRQYFGQLFSMVSMYHAAKRIACKLTGRPAPVDMAGLNADGFKSFEENKKRSKKPLWVFLFFTIGIPWLISKLYQRLQRQRLEAANAAGGLLGPGNPAAGLTGPDGLPLHPNQIRDLEFCRALFDFTAETPTELSFKKGDIVAILSKLDPATGQPGPWWRGRLQSGQMGMFPANYVELIQKKNLGGSSSSSSPSPAPAVPSQPSTSYTPSPSVSMIAKHPTGFDPQAFHDPAAMAPFGPNEFGPSFQ